MASKLYRRADRLWRLDRTGQFRLRNCEDCRFVEDIAHIGFHTVFGEGVQPFAVDARILVFVLDLPAALLDGDGAAL